MYFKGLPCQRGHYMSLNMSWAKLLNARGTQIVTQFVLNKHLACPRRHKPLKCQLEHNIPLTLICPNPFHAVEETKFNLTCVEKPFQ